MRKILALTIVFALVTMLASAFTLHGTSKSDQAVSKVEISNVDMLKADVLLVKAEAVGISPTEVPRPESMYVSYEVAAFPIFSAAFETANQVPFARSIGFCYERSNAPILSGVRGI